MKRNFHYLILLLALVVLAGCETTKYAFNQTFGDQQEFGKFQSKVKPQGQSDIMLENADGWVKEHLW